MWIFMNDAFLSIVEPPNQSDVLLVRARVRGDLERVFPEAEVVETTERDYRFRTFLPRKQVADVISKQVMNIDYGNFKNSVNEDLRHDAYAQVWEVMYKLQHKLKGRTIAEFETHRS